MSVDFSKVTDIKIPQGNVRKIEEWWPGGNVLWEKIAWPYPLFFILMKTSGGYCATMASDGGTTYGTGSALSPLSNISSIPIPSGIYSSWGRDFPYILNVGDTLSARFVKNNTERDNAETLSQELTDAQWKISPTQLYAGSDYMVKAKSNYSTQNLAQYIDDSLSAILTSSCPLTFSATTGANISVTDIKALENYKAIYNAIAGDKYKSVSEAPYLFISFFVTYTSSKIENLLTTQNRTIKTDYYPSNLPAMNGFRMYSPLLCIWAAIQR